MHRTGLAKIVFLILAVAAAVLGAVLLWTSRRHHPDYGADVLAERHQAEKDTEPVFTRDDWSNSGAMGGGG